MGWAHFHLTLAHKRELLLPNGSICYSDAQHLPPTQHPLSSRHLFREHWVPRGARASPSPGYSHYRKTKASGSASTVLGIEFKR